METQSSGTEDINIMGFERGIKNNKKKTKQLGKKKDPD